MLRQESNNTSLVPAEQVRVTPEELTAAITELQAQKEGASGTIAIGDAIEELSLDVSPADVLREVEAQRQRGHRRSRTATRKRKWGVALAACVFFSLGFGVYSEVSSNSSGSYQIIPATTPFALEPRILAMNPAAPKRIISTLTEAPEGQTVYISAGAVDAAAMSRNQLGEVIGKDDSIVPQRFIDQQPGDLNWPVVKYGKDLYVRGWVRMPLSKDAAKLADMEVFNSPNAPQLGLHSQQVTFKLDLISPLDGYQRLTPDGMGEFTFREPRLTSHTYEKWQP